MKQVCLILFCICLVACDRKAMMVSSSGMPFELVVVMDDTMWNSLPGRSLDGILTGDIEALPQPEPEFNVIRINPDQFDQMFQVVRNILFVDISSKYDENRMLKLTDRWARNQEVLYIQSPDEASFEEYVSKNKEAIISYFVTAEINRFVSDLKQNYNRGIYSLLKQQFNISIYLPAGMNKYKQENHFFWATNDQASGRQDFVIYKVPFSGDLNSLSRKELIMMRDSIMKYQLPGDCEDCYWETDQNRPVNIKSYQRQNEYCLELRGLWRIHGDMMGGPFVSHLIQNGADREHLLVIECFIYAPGEKKRNLLRRTEAILYTLTI